MMANEFSLELLEHSSSKTPVLFDKRTVVELTDEELVEIQGGTSPAIAASIASVWATIQIGKAGYEFGQWLR